MLTQDLMHVDWRGSQLKICSFCTSKQLHAILQSDDHAARAVAHAHLKRAEINKLWTRPSQQETAAFRASLGRRIQQTECLEFCDGLVEQRIYKVLGRFPKALQGHTWTNRDVHKALLAES